MKPSSLKRWCLLVLLLFLQSWAHAQYVPDAGYEAAKRPSGQSNPTCPTNPNLPDSWGFSVSTCECVSYVAYRLNLNNVRHNGVLFKNYWTSSTHFGYAYNWRSQALLLGIHEDQYPAVGSVAYWDTSKIPGTGHVAYVQHLFTNKTSGKLDAVGLMEYNWANPNQAPDHKYRYRKVYPRKGGGWPTSFLHFEEKGTDADKTNVTCVTGLNKGVYKPGGANDGTFCWEHASNSNASCSGAPNRYYFDYQTCTRYSVGSSYCNGVTADLPGYTAKLTSDANFPRPLDPYAEKKDFAFCDGTTSSAQGNSNLISGRTPKERVIFWRDITTD